MSTPPSRLPDDRTPPIAGRWTFDPAAGTASLCDTALSLLQSSEVTVPNGEPAWLRRVHGHDRTAVSTALVQATNGSSVPLCVACRLRLGDNGPSIDAEYGWFRIEALNDSGVIRGTLSRMAADDNAFDLLAQRIQRLETMLSAVSECFKIVDQDANLLEMNNAGLDLIEAESLDQVRGASVLDILCPEYHSEFKRGLEAAQRGERVTQQFEIEGLRGTRRWMEQVAVALPAPNGAPTEIGAFTRDITLTTRMIEDLSEARLSAEEASRAKSEFLANMSHEIRTPLTAILGFSELLGPDGDFAGDDEAMRDAVHAVRSNAEHLLAVVNDVLDMSRIEAGRMVLESLAVDPSEVVDQVVTLLRPRAAERGLSLNVRVTGTAPGVIMTDPTRLRQVLLNLVGNAIKFTDRGSVTIDMHDDRETRQLAFRIEDTGIGMTPEELARISAFEPFSQADTSTTRRFGGTGLGLRISNALCRLLGGELGIVSSLGQGSVFTALVSAAPAKTAGTDAPIRQIRPMPRDTGTDCANRLPGVRILLAEDGVDNQRLVAHHLRKHGAVVEIAENGLLAVEAVQATPDAFDLVLMDMQMPELDGYDATRRLRCAGFSLPIVALTAHAMTGDRERCLNAGCNDFLSKPIDATLLIETCRVWAIDDERPSQAA